MQRPLQAADIAGIRAFAVHAKDGDARGRDSAKRHVEQDHPILHRLQRETAENQHHSENSHPPLRHMIGAPLDYRTE